MRYHDIIRRLTFSETHPYNRGLGQSNIFSSVCFTKTEGSKRAMANKQLLGMHTIGYKSLYSYRIFSSLVILLTMSHVYKCTRDSYMFLLVLANVFKKTETQPYNNGPLSALCLSIKAAQSVSSLKTSMFILQFLNNTCKWSYLVLAVLT